MSIASIGSQSLPQSSPAQQSQIAFAPVPPNVVSYSFQDPVDLSPFPQPIQRFPSFGGNDRMYEVCSDYESPPQAFSKMEDMPLVASPSPPSYDLNFSPDYHWDAIGNRGRSSPQFEEWNGCISPLPSPSFFEEDLTVPPPAPRFLPGRASPPTFLYRRGSFGLVSFPGNSSPTTFPAPFIPRSPPEEKAGVVSALRSRNPKRKSVPEPSPPIAPIQPHDYADENAEEEEEVVDPQDPVDPDDENVFGVYTRKQRRDKVDRYRMKRLHRAKKVKYLSRKKFADNRPRVGGRFVKLAPSP